MIFSVIIIRKDGAEFDERIQRSDRQHGSSRSYPPHFEAMFQVLDQVLDSDDEAAHVEVQRATQPSNHSSVFLLIPIQTCANTDQQLPGFLVKMLIFRKFWESRIAS